MSFATFFAAAVTTFVLLVPAGMILTMSAVSPVRRAAARRPSREVRDAAREPAALSRAA